MFFPQPLKLLNPVGGDCIFLEYRVSGCTFVLEEESHDCPEEEDLLLLEPDPILAEEDFPLSSNRRSSYQN